MGGLLSALEVVGGAAMMFVPGGQLAGAMMIASGVATSGLIGGSVGKFMNSDLGKGLMAAVSLGSAAVAMYGASAAAAGAEETAQVSQLAAQDTASLGTDIGAGSASDAVATNSSLIQATDAGQNVASMADASTTAASGTDAASQAAVNAASPAAGGIAQSVGGAQASQASAAATNADTAATAPLAAPGAATAAPGTAPAGAAASPLATTSATPGAQPLVGDTQPGSPLAGGGTAGDDQLGIPQSDIGTKVPPGGATNPGMLSQAASFVGKNPGVAVAGGQMLSGLAQGAAQEKTMQEQLAAAQWGNLQWQNPAEVSQLQAAAAAPITVPQGYLQRAQQVRGLMTGATASPGVQPLPIAGAAPGAPLAPKLPGQA